MVDLGCRCKATQRLKEDVRNHSATPASKRPGKRPAHSSHFFFFTFRVIYGLSAINTYTSTFYATGRTATVLQLDGGNGAGSSFS